MINTIKKIIFAYGIIFGILIACGSKDEMKKSNGSELLLNDRDDNKVILPESSEDTTIFQSLQKNSLKHIVGPGIVLGFTCGVLLVTKKRICGFISTSSLAKPHSVKKISTNFSAPLPSLESSGSKVGGKRLIQ